MKHLKKFESSWEDERQEKKETEEEIQIEILRNSIEQNPLSEDNDFYIFLAGDRFEEDEDGRYRKTLDIENMVRITPDMKSIGAMQGLQMRARFQQGVKLYSIWLPKELQSDVEGKGSLSLEPYLVDLINKYKQTGSTEEGRQKFKEIEKKAKEDVPGRRKITKKFNV